jgi:hypothetical protein
MWIIISLILSVITQYVSGFESYKPVGYLWKLTVRYFPFVTHLLRCQHQECQITELNEMISKLPPTTKQAFLETRLLEYITPSFENNYHTLYALTKSLTAHTSQLSEEKVNNIGKLGKERMQTMKIIPECLRSTILGVTVSTKIGPRKIFTLLPKSTSSPTVKRKYSELIIVQNLEILPRSETTLPEDEAVCFTPYDATQTSNQTSECDSLVQNASVTLWSITLENEIPSSSTQLHKESQKLSFTTNSPVQTKKKMEKPTQDIVVTEYSMRNCEHKNETQFQTNNGMFTLAKTQHDQQRVTVIPDRLYLELHSQKILIVVSFLFIVTYHFREQHSTFPMEEIIRSYTVLWIPPEKDTNKNRTWIAQVASGHYSTRPPDITRSPRVMWFTQLFLQVTTD